MLDQHIAQTMQGIYVVTGIDTDIGKTIATGTLAKALQQQHRAVITQKMIQTGAHGHSPDIETHRHLMQINSDPPDLARLTAPIVLDYPASPHLAAQLSGQPVELDLIRQASHQLAEKYDVVLLEGAGGLMVPLQPQYLIIDYIAEQGYPVILVTSGRLGSINHTLLSLLAIRHYGLRLFAVIYNQQDDALDPVISADTARYLRDHVQQHFLQAHWLTLPVLDQSATTN